MNDSEASHTHEDISGQLGALQRQVFTLLLAFTVVSSTFVAFLYYQAHVMSSNVEVFRAQTRQMIQNSASVSTASMDAFANQITAYALAHPDFQPILKKYGWVPPAATTKPATTALPPKK